MPAFSQLTTLRLGGEISTFVPLHSLSEIHDYHHDIPAASESFVLGGGSNIVAGDYAIQQAIIQLCNDHFIVHCIADDRPYAEIAAGITLDEAIAELIVQGWGGLELLSGIPGTCGGAAVQNIGAYGIEIANLIKRVQIFDRENRKTHWWEVSELEYSYRNSRLKNSTRYIVISLEIWLKKHRESQAITFSELTRQLEIPPHSVANSAEVRAAVLGLRRQKGMVLDVHDHDTWSVGSFFINPTVSETDYYELQEKHKASIPGYPTMSAGIKIPAAWLIEQAGFPKGYPGGAAGIWLSTKHTLALSNRGNGTTQELLALAREIRTGVQEHFGIHLIPEPVFVECQL